jgi:mannose-6-phosphate isomerase-like protein (cupin superfamily)
MEVVSTNKALKHYIWGNGCDGWNLVDEETLSVKQERMPAGTAEAKHYHQKAQQFFYILKGVASFEFENSIINVKSGESLHVKAGTIHKISNLEIEDLEFVLCSQPSTNNDRINCE